MIEFRFLAAVAVLFRAFLAWSWKRAGQIYKSKSFTSILLAQCSFIASEEAYVVSSTPEELYDAFRVLEADNR